MSENAPPLICIDGSDVDRRADGGRSDRGWFFLAQVPIDAGAYEGEFALNLPVEGANVTIEAVAWKGVAATSLARNEFRVIESTGPGRRFRLRFDVAENALLQLRGYTDPGFEAASLAELSVREIGGGTRRRSADGLNVLNSPRRPAWPAARLGSVIIGTTSICNASCVHCPTNKAMTRHLPNKVMSLDLFEKLLIGLRDLAIPIDNAIGFGLYAEALLDPLVVERAAMVKRHLPGASLVMNTNGGPLTDALATALAPFVDCFTVHIEAVDPALYHSLMRPLRAEVVFPKVERLIRLSGKPVAIICPVHARNVAEFPRVRDYWMERGAFDVSPSFLWNRCTEGLGFADLALAPGPGRCGSEVAADLIVDWDGAVLTCCQDFLKRNKIGDLTRESVAEVLANSARRDVFQKLGEGRWSEFATCKDCRCDSFTAVKATIADLERGGPARRDALQLAR